MQTFDLLILAPIPVGHRVEMRWYKMAITGLLTGQRHESRPYHPLVRDLDTGIIYGEHDLFRQRNVVVSTPSATPTQLQWDPLPEHQVEYQLSGRVVACRLSSHQTGGQHGNLFVQTTLVVEPQ